ncbi:MAG: protein kinase domain-containing protein, partial [Planctomycetales bacterium]
MRCEYCRIDVPAGKATEHQDSYRCPHCGRTLPFGGETTTTNQVDVPPTDADPVLVFPDYQVQRKLGTGGMGVVYEALRTVDNKSVAIKVLAREHSGNPTLVTRFRREATALSRLQHPNIVAIFDQGEVAGRPYFVMEYIPGPERGLRGDLGAHIPPAGLDQRLARKILLQICDALIHVHQNGIIHRDVKPSNVMIDESFNAKLADFGIAALSTGHGNQVTTHQGPMGTGAYMSPEQFKDASSVDARTDIYSLGVVLHEMLTGDLPRGKGASTVNPQLWPEWDVIIDKALAPNRVNRYATMREFADAARELDVNAQRHLCQECGKRVAP